MTIRVPAFVLAIIAVMIGSTIISFGVAYAVYEWRQSDYIDCVADAQDKLIDEYDQHRATRPDSPDSPGSGASEAAYEAYRQQFAQYETASDAWDRRNDEINTAWGVEVRACR